MMAPGSTWRDKGQRDQRIRGESMPAKKTTILAADDDPQILRLVTRNLQFEGYEVIAVSDGQAALEQIEAHSPDRCSLRV